jgi:hypothetical protein
MIGYSNTRRRPGTWGDEGPARRDGTSTSASRAQEHHERRGDDPQVILGLALTCDGRPCGQFVYEQGRILLVKRGLDATRHQLQKPCGWAAEQAHLEQLRELGGDGVRLHTVDGETFSASLAAFDKHGIELDRGHGVQVVLPLKFWQHDAPGVQQLRLGLGGATW